MFMGCQSIFQDYFFYLTSLVADSERDTTPEEKTELRDLPLKTEEGGNDR